MKTKFIFAVLSMALSLPAFATSMEHPVSWSAGQVIKLLQNKEVMEKLSKEFDPIESIEATKNEEGEYGWLISTKTCQLFAQVQRKLIKRIPGHPFGGYYSETIEVGACK